MKKFQSLNDELFNDSELSFDQMKQSYGGVYDDGGGELSKTTFSGWTSDCSTHTAGDGSGHSNDGCDSKTDTTVVEDPKE